MRNHRSDHILVATGLALTTGLLNACSSNASGDKPDTNASSTVKSAEGATLIFTQCIRGRGFDIPDAGPAADNLNGTSDAFNDTINERQQKINPALGEENDLTKDLAVQEQLIKGAECLRDLGYDVADPKVDKDLDIKDIPSDALQKCFSSQGA